MANTIVTPTKIAMEALMQLENNCVMGKLVHREYKDEYVDPKAGGTVSIRKPVKFVASDGATRVNQDVEEATTPFAINKRKHVSWKFSTNDLTLSIEEYSARYIRPAMIALGNQVDADLCALQKNVFANVGTAGTTPTTFLHFGAASQRMDEYAVPQDSRVLVLNPAASLTAQDMLKGVYNPEIVKGAIRGRTIGQLAGFDTYQDQNINSHVRGTAWAGSAAVAGASQSVAYSAATHTYGSTSQTLNVTIGTTVLTVLPGDRFTIAGVFQVNPVSKVTTGVLQEFVVNVAASTTVTTGAAALNISPAIIISGPYQTVDAAPGATAAITAVANHAANMAFHKNAFGLVTCPLELPDGAAFKSRQSANGYSVRVVKDYDIAADEDIIRIDILYGVKALYPELACILKG